jgi:hypothetical protein
MSLESFIGMDSGGEPMSAASLEKLQERMKAASAQIKQIKKEEKKAKKKEHDLLNILLKFVKTSHKTDLTLLISRAIEINVPANFIITVILLGNEDIQEEVGEALSLNAPTADEKALTFFGEDETLPLKIKIELDKWIKDMLAQSEEYPQKMIKTGYKTELIELEKEYEFDEQKYEEKKSVQPALIKLVAFVVNDYLAQNSLQEPAGKLKEFATFILKGILSKTAENLDQRDLLE